MAPSRNSSSTRSWLLGAALLFAIFMGAGPGVYLVNPDANAGEAATVGGIPILYAWYTCWFFVEAIIVVIAFFTVWRKEDAGQ